MHVLADFPEVCVIDGGCCDVGLESTVIKVVLAEDGRYLSDESWVIKILRPGKISSQELDKFAKVEIAYTTVPLDDSQAADVPEAPGMKYKHYAPRGEVFLVQQPEEVTACAETVVLIAFDDFDLNRFSGIRMSLGSLSDLDEASRRLFSCLRRCDDLGALSIFVDVRFDRETPGIGQALWNRISKAALKR
jgi:L-threonylcarbamoyladenylate synthase